jgi:hypothetical protein
MNESTNKGTTAATAKQLIAGVQKHFSTASSLAFGSGTYTPAQITASLQTLVDLRSAVDDAKTTAKARIAEESAQAPPLRRQMSALSAFVRATFSESPDVLADFGLKPRKARTPMTIEQKAGAAAKRAATRAARHTMGKRQKAEVKGTVTTIVASTTPAASSPIVTSAVASTPSQGGGPAIPQGTASAVAAPHA